MTDHSAISAYHARLPYGESVSPEPVLGGDFFPFTGDVGVVPLAEPEVPEPPRNGEDGGGICWRCSNPDTNVVWRDEHWHVRGADEPSGLPLVVHMAPNEHATLHTMGPEALAAMGPLIQRIAVALGTIDSVGRTHVNRWGDGSEHFHLWFLARPLGMMQLRGATIAVWDDLLPAIPVEEMQTNLRTLAAALARDGGTAYV